MKELRTVELRTKHSAVLYGSRRTGFLHVLVDKFLIKCVTHEGFVEKVNSVSS